MWAHLKSKEPFALAYLWNVWHKPDGKKVESFTIITTEPNELVPACSQPHARNPSDRSSSLRDFIQIARRIESICQSTRSQASASIQCSAVMRPFRFVIVHHVVGSIPIGSTNILSVLWLTDRPEAFDCNYFCN